MPSLSDLQLYFNIAFFAVLGMGLLIGFLRGFRKALWGFLVSLIFIVFFFYTIDVVVNQIWLFSIPQLGDQLSALDSGFSGVTSLSEALPKALEIYLPAEFSGIATNANLLELAVAISLFVVKIVYTILYFTVIQLFYRLILWIVKSLFTPSKKKSDKYRAKNRGLGAIVGLLRGGLSLAITLVIFGGLISITDSITNLVPEETPVLANQTSMQQGFSHATDPIVSYDSAFAMPGIEDYEESIEFLENLSIAYNGNAVVTTTNQITMANPNNPEEQMPLNLYLFDSVLSITYKEEVIAIRAEIEVLSEVAAGAMNSEFMNTQILNDLQADEVRTAFNTLSRSSLFQSLLPVVIEVGSEVMGVTLDIPVEDLYDIDWETELSQIGEVAAVGLDIVNASGILNEETDIATVVLDGDDVGALFTSLGESQLVTLAAYVAIDPLLEQAGSTFQALITVPTDIVWADEFNAIGALASSVLNAGLTVSSVSDADVGAILTVLGDIDFTIIMDSRIITNAMINILSGNVPDIPIGDYITVPTDLVWLNTMDGDTVVYGEIYNILQAVNALADSASSIDFSSFENLNVSTLSQFTANDINALFESTILRATITDYIKDNPFGEEFAIIMPDTVFDSDGYIVKTELQYVVDAAFMLVDNLTCDLGDTECEALGIDINKIFTLDGNNMDTLLASDVLHASVGHMLLTMGGTTIVVPGSAKESVNVDSVATEIVTKLEIKNAFLAIATLGIDDITSLDIDPSILNNLADDTDPTLLDQTKADTLFGSKILNATLSKYLLDFAEQEGAIIVVPAFEEDGTTPVKVTDSVDTEVVYISETELTNILQAVLSLDIQDFNSIDSITIDTLLSNVDDLLASSILQATISKQLIDMDTIVVVPQNDQLGNPLRISVGTAPDETIYIASSELENAIDAISALGITDINNVAFDTTILNNLALESDPTELDPAKSTRLFSSSIINATLSKYLIDFTEGGMVVVPWEDESGNTVRIEDAVDGTQYIVQGELTEILEAVLKLDITDFESMDTFSVDTILLNIDELLDSAILQATISKQMMDVTAVVVPSENELGNPVIITQGPDVTKETTFILSTELENAFNAIQVLGINDISNIAFDMTILDNLALAGDSTELDPVKASTLFSSAVINATLSKYIIDFTDTPDPFLIVPYVDQDNTTVRYINTDLTEVITQNELTNILKAVLKLDLASFDSAETLTITTIVDNKTVILNSAILHASVSKQIREIPGGLVIIPEVQEDGITEVLRTRGLAGQETTYVERLELEALLDSLVVLNLLDINNFTGALDLTLLSAPGATATLASSTIIQATVTKQVLDMVDAIGTSTEVIVPYETPDGLTDLRVTVGTTVQTELIIKSEIENLLNAFVGLGLGDINSVGNAITINTLATNAATIFESYIIQATVSKQVINIESATVVVPYWSDNLVTPEQLRMTSGDPLVLETEYIKKSELINLMEALNVLIPIDQGVDYFSGGTVDLSLFYDITPRTTLLDSYIMQATVSKQIINLGATAIEVPDYEQDTITPVKLVAGSGLEETSYITDDELHDLFEALELLGLNDVSGFNASSLSFTMFMPSQNVNYDTNQNILLASACIQATMSSQVVDLGALIEVPTHDVLNQAVHTQLISGTDYITVSELKLLFNALDVLGFTDITGFTGTIGLSALFELSDPLFDTNQNTVLSSAIMHRTFTKQITDLDGTQLVVPTLDVSGSAIGLTQSTNYYITNLQIKHLLNAMNEIGFTGNLSGFDGNINLSALSSSASQDKLLLSAIMHATISDKIIGTTLVVPDHDLNRVVDIRLTQASVEFIENIELKALLTSLDALGLTDYSSMNVNLGTALAQDQNTVLASAIIQATISDNFLDTAKLYAVAISGEFIVPQAKREAISVNSVASEWIEINELKAIMTAMNGDNLNITTFSVSFSGNIFNGMTPTQINTVFNSASMHLTVEKMIKLNANVNTYIPDITGQVVIVDSLYSLTDIISVQETVNFVLAIDALGGSITGDFDSSSLTLLTAAQRQTVIESSIARCRLTEDFENMMILNGTPYGPSDYEILDTVGEDCLTEAAAQAALLLM